MPTTIPLPLPSPSYPSLYPQSGLATLQRCGASGLIFYQWALGAARNRKSNVGATGSCSLAEQSGLYPMKDAVSTRLPRHNSDGRAAGLEPTYFVRKTSVIADCDSSIRRGWSLSIGKDGRDCWWKWDLLSASAFLCNISYMYRLGSSGTHFCSIFKEPPGKLPFLWEHICYSG